MKPHKLYKLSYEFPIADTLVGLVSASLSYELYKALLGERVAMPLCVLTGTGVFFCGSRLNGFSPAILFETFSSGSFNPQFTRRQETTKPHPS
jgi:hypothetical protein